MPKDTRRDAVLDLLAAIQEDWTKTTEAMVTTVVCRVMRHSEVTSVSIDFSVDGMAAFIENNTMERKFEEIDGKQFIRFTVLPKTGPEMEKVWHKVMTGDAEYESWQWKTYLREEPWMLP